MEGEEAVVGEEEGEAEAVMAKVVPAIVAAVAVEEEAEGETRETITTVVARVEQALSRVVMDKLQPHQVDLDPI